MALRSKLANLYAREDSENDFWVKYFRSVYYPPIYSKESRVAVKCVRPEAPEKSYTDLASELKLMVHIGEHKNIVNLLGACTLDGPLWEILEFCPNGDLRKYLRTKKLIPTWERLEMTTDDLGYMDLSRMSLEIAEGMIFLSASGIVHRDLAARNVLVGARFEMKIADFGLARDIGGMDEEYNAESERPIPIRWSAPEAITMGIYSTSSDVWSYGVVLWELYSMGQNPYGGMTNYDVKMLVEKGERLTSPTNCPENMYLLMQGCWNKEPK